MSFEIEAFDMLEFDVPAGKGKKLTLSVPPMDCLDPADVEKMNADLEKIGATYEGDPINDPTKNGAALVRYMLKYYNPGKEKEAVIDRLVPRQLNQIDKVWTEASDITLGESEPSTDESTPTKQ
ncbi:hypothetical protein [Corynebacterium cystitidis]|uniref:hypothetical protein n=1 Tax=Corynebacterium cystitidis TaxID=35757 RepID=UPI00211F3B71|nr:hypothetical protein [Corynebacterium cystitidis]